MSLVSGAGQEQECWGFTGGGCLHAEAASFYWTWAHAHQPSWRNLLLLLLLPYNLLPADQLNVKAGLEFIAARKALIEQLRGEEAASTAAAEDEAAAAAAVKGEAAAQAEQQPQPPQQQQQRQRTWLQMCVAADRPVMDTLMGLWGALGPWKRLELLFGVAWTLVWKVRGYLGWGIGVGSVANSCLFFSVLSTLGCIDRSVMDTDESVGCAGDLKRAGVAVWGGLDTCLEGRGHCAGVGFGGGSVAVLSQVEVFHAGWYSGTLGCDVVTNG